MGCCEHQTRYCAADPIPDATAWDADFSKRHWVTPPDMLDPGCSISCNPYWAVRVQLVRLFLARVCTHGLVAFQLVLGSLLIAGSVFKWSAQPCKDHIMLLNAFCSRRCSHKCPGSTMASC